MDFDEMKQTMKHEEPKKESLLPYYMKRINSISTMDMSNYGIVDEEDMKKEMLRRIYHETMDEMAHHFSFEQEVNDIKDNLLEQCTN